MFASSAGVILRRRVCASHRHFPKTFYRGFRNHVRKRSDTAAVPPADLKSADGPAQSLLARLRGSKEVIEYLRPAKRELIIGLCCLPPALAATMALPYYVGSTIDAMLSSDGGIKPEVIATLVGISVVGGVATFGRSYYINLSSEVIVKNLRKRIFAETIRKDALFFDRHKTGDLINRLSTDTTIISNTLTESVSLALRGMATMSIGSGFLFYTCKELALVSTGSLLPLIVLARFYGSIIKKETQRQLETFGESTSSAEEALSNAKFITLFNRHGFMADRYNTKIDGVFDIGRRVSLYRGFFMGSTNLMVSLSMLSVLGYGSTMVAAGAISAGQMTTFLLYMVNVAGAAFSLTSVYSSIMRALGANERISELITASDTNGDTSEVREALSSSGTLAHTDTYDIAFQGVSFAYPTRPDSPVLQNMTLSIPQGKSVAILGGSGSGKSTLINLMGRLYAPNKGHILLGGHPLEEFQIEYLREIIGVVTQDPIILNASIASNIRLGKLDASEEQIIDAAKHANIHDFVQTLPQGYDTVVGERGSLLSGGQKQRITIARKSVRMLFCTNHILFDLLDITGAILRDPKILILDEATSSLDVENEALVQQGKPVCNAQESNLAYLRGCE